MSLEGELRIKRQNDFREFEISDIESDITMIVEYIGRQNNKIATLESQLDQVQMKVYNRGD